MLKRLYQHRILLSIIAMAFAYYLVLCAKTMTWVFMGSDVGDWLASARWWMVPQPVGSPLYIGLGHLLNVLPGDLTLKMTVLLSVLPAAITIGVTYLITLKITNNAKLSVLSASVLLGAGVFLSQATILEEYALAVMFLCLGFYAYLRQHYIAMAVMLGFGVAVHAILLMPVLFWLFLERRNISLLRSLPWLALTGFAPYVLVLVLMYIPSTPPLLAEKFSVAGLKDYLFGITGGIVGNLSIFEAPERFLQLGEILLASLGLAIVPIVVALRRPYNVAKLVMVAVVLWFVWYFASNVDPISWTFMAFSMPFLAVLTGIGLSKLSSLHFKAVAIVAVMLIVFNTITMNANVLTAAQPLATNYEASLKELPAGSVVVTDAGCYSLGLFNVMSQGYQLIPVVYPYIDEWNRGDYASWLSDTYGLAGDSTPAIVECALGQSLPVYFAGPQFSHADITRAFVVSPVDSTQVVYPITGLTGLEPLQAVRMQ